MASLLAPAGARGSESLSLPRARVPLLSGVSPCPKLEPPSGVNPSLKLERESESQASAPSGVSPCSWNPSHRRPSPWQDRGRPGSVPQASAAHSPWPARSRFAVARLLPPACRQCSPPVTPASHSGPNRPRPAEATTVAVTTPRSARRVTIPHSTQRERGRAAVEVGCGLRSPPPPGTPAAALQPLLRQHLVGCRRQRLLQSAPFVDSFRRTTSPIDTIRLARPIRTDPRMTLVPTRRRHRRAGESTFCRTTPLGHADDFTDPMLSRWSFRFMNAHQLHAVLSPCTPHSTVTHSSLCRRSGETIELNGAR